MRSVTIYTSYFAQFMKARLAYRVDFFASILANILVTLSGLLFVVFLLDGKVVPSLQGWSREEVLFIYGYSMISVSFFYMLAPNLYGFGDRYVVQGQFDRVLLRPLNTLGQIIFESFNLESIGSLLTGLGVLIYASVKLNISFGLIDCLWLVTSAVSGSIILISIFVVLASFSFHFEDRMGIAPPFFNMITFGRFPLPIFNGTIQFILRWVVPYAFIAFYPATHFFNRTGFEFYCYFTPVMAAISLVVAWTLWQYGVSRYSSTGN
jgi:ABC-2 type transport system permease protein